jgi:CheY-like chemotaxis protein
MPPQVLERAFDPFYTTKPTGQGTGLGLSMVYGFVRQSEGRIAIDSEVGRGTEVKMYLPRLTREALSPEPVPLEPIAPPAPGQASETLLVVEDEAAVRELILEALQDLGYHILEAADGPAGLRILDTGVHVDLLVTDIGLPGGLNGRQMADAARVRRPDLRVLFMTGYAESAARGGGFLPPGMALIPKPFTIEVLTSRIREMLAMAPAAE